MAAAAGGSKTKVLQLGTIEHAHDYWAGVGEIADIIVPQATNREAFIQECRSGDLDGVQVAYRTFTSVSQTGRVDEELLSALPSSLRFICHNGAGYDQIDVAACTARDVRVSNTPTAVDEATADLHIFLLLGALRNLGPGMASIRAGHWRGAGSPPIGHDPEGKVLGILGMGGIGRTVARKAAAAFNMKIVYHNRRRLSEDVEAEAGAAEYIPTLEALLEQANVLSINVPLNSNTRHLIGTAELARMKPGAVLVNTARGAIVDEEALVAALESGHLAGAGLDVFEHEPKVHPGLLASDKVVIVPHMGTSTVETETKMEVWTMSNVRMAVESGRLRTIVPEQASLQEEDVKEIGTANGKQTEPANGKV